MRAILLLLSITLSLLPAAVFAEAPILPPFPEPYGGGPCEVSSTRAATLLVPYFEVDSIDPIGIDTLVAVTNTWEEPVVVHVTLWTTDGVPSFDFNIYLTGRDVATFSMRRIIVDGIKVEGEEARRVVRQAMRAARGDSKWADLWHLLAIFLLATVLGAAVAYGTIMLLHSLGVGATGPFAVAASACTGAVVGAVWIRLYFRRHRREFRQAMSELGYELCPGCGYWLRGLPDDTDRCPECGAKREVTVDAAADLPQDDAESAAGD